jgi:hypothetical protein
MMARSGRDGSASTRSPVETRAHVPQVISTWKHHTLQDYETQLMLLEQMEKRRWMAATPQMKSLLIWAAQTGSLDLFETLLKNPRVDINGQDQNQQSALMFAVAYDNKHMVAALLGRPDIRVNLRDDNGRSTQKAPVVS